jgi:hypothetical protein
MGVEHDGDTTFTTDVLYFSEDAVHFYTFIGRL